MNRQKLTLIACGAALALASWPAQAQDAPRQSEMPLREFRQALLDAGSYLDAHRGTDIQRKFAAVPDYVVEKWYSAVPNPREFQKAVAELKRGDASPDRRRQPMPDASSLPLTVSPACPPNSIIDNSLGAQCTPPYPDPANSSWKSMISPLIPIGAYPSTASFTDISSQHCSLTTEANLQLVSVVMQGITNVGSIGCNAIPDPADSICFAALSVVALANQSAVGLWTSCAEQDGLVNAAEVDAGFRNTVTIYNSLKGVTTDISNGFSSLDNFLTNLGTLVNNDFTSLNGSLTNLGTQVTNVGNAVHGDFSALDTHITNINNQVTGEFTTQDTHLTNINNQINGEFTSLDTHLTNVDTQVAAEATALDAHIVALVNQLASQIGQGTALVDANLKQAMKLEMTPEGQRVINPLILTCTGTNCPNVLATCPAAGCSWNNVGPLP